MVRNERYETTIVKSNVLYLKKLSRRDLVQQCIKIIAEIAVNSMVVARFNFCVT